ncbi:hypothetical protein RIF29_00686 [Crotalaria pallida]|uniref:Uncharacterized protein n=1 Tax=Crotalaria pallida TaxID=3830 RepID=A0AAN9IWS6_CROPI
MSKYELKAKLDKVKSLNVKMSKYELKAKLDKVKSLNVKLESHSKKLIDDLDAAIVEANSNKRFAVELRNYRLRPAYSSSSLSDGAVAGSTSSTSSCNCCIATSISVGGGVVAYHQKPKAMACAIAKLMMMMMEMDIANSWEWKVATDGIYSVKSAYKELRGQVQSGENEQVKAIWEANAPLKTKAFG